MDAQTVRTALGTIQSNPSDEGAWQSLSDAMVDSAGELALPEALELLEAASSRHSRRGESQAVARILELCIKSAEGSDVEAALVSELAKVLVEELFDARRAIDVLEKAVNRLGTNDELVASLEELKIRADAYEEQAGTYRQEAESAADDDYRSAMLMRSAEAEVCFSIKPSFTKAVEDLETALRLDSTNGPASKLLEAIFRRQGDFEGLVQVLERVADRSPSREEKVAAGVRLARLYLHHFEDQGRAATAYDLVLESAPSHADAMEFVTEFYSAEERWDDLVRVYERPLKGASEEPELGDMLQVAMLHWKMRGVAVDAEPWFERISRLEPAHDGVLDFYREYKAALKDDAGLVRVLRAARKTLLDDDERAAALDEEIAEKEGQQVGAQRLIEKWKSALRASPDNEEARKELKDLYKQTQGHNALVELLRQELERAPEDEYAQRLGVMREIAVVYRSYVKSDTALVGVLNQIVNLDGKLDEQDVEEVRELVALYEKLSRPRDHLSSLKILAEIVPNHDEKVSLYRQVGRRWLEQFSNVQHAMEAFAALHALEPSDEEANERLEDLYRKRRSWKELFALYDERLASAEGEERIPLLREMAQLAAERLNKVEDALGYYRQVLELDPSRIEVLDRMEKHAERSKNWSVLADVLERRLSLMGEEDTPLGVLQKLGTVYADNLKSPEQAIGAWRRVLEAEPKHPRAMRVLRDVFLKSSRFDELEALYTEQGEFEGLAEVLSTAADRNSDPEEKLELSYRAARVYEEELGQAPRAIRSYERILSINGKDRRAISRLLPLYEREEKWARIPSLLEVLVELAEDDDARVAVYALLVDVTGVKLADKKGAVAYARRAFEGAPTNSQAMDLLDVAVRAAGAWDEMVLALETRLTQLGSAPSETAPSKTTQETTEKKLDSSSPAAPATGKGAKKRRKRKGRKTGADQSEPAAVQTESDALKATSEQRPIILRLCRVLGEELGRVEEAVTKLKALAADSPRDPEIMGTLETLLRRDSRPEELRWLFEHRRIHAEDDILRALVLCEWAAFEENSAEDQDAALLHYNQALSLRPDDEGTLEAVVRLALSLNQVERAVEALAQHRDLLSGQAAAEKDALLAELLASRLARPAEALNAAKRALEGGAEPGVLIPVLQRLVEVKEVRGIAAKILSEQYEAGGDSRQEADAVRALISETEEEEEKVELFKKLASIFEDKLNEPGAALSVILEALTVFPLEIELWDRAVPLAEQSGRPTELSEAIRSVLRTELPDELVLDLARRAVVLHETVLDDPQGAVLYYEKIRFIDPDDSDVFSRLRAVLTSGERWRELEELYDAEIQRLDDDVRSIEMLSEVALLSEDIMGDAERAIGYHRRILEIDPESSVSLEGLDRLYCRTDNKLELLGILQTRAKLASDEAQHAHLVRVAQTAISLHRPEQAAEAVEKVLSEDPGNYESRDIAEELLLVGGVKARVAKSLELVYESKDEIRDLVRVLGVRVESLRPQEGEELDESEVSDREEERRDLLRRIATLRDDRLHDDEGSFDVFAELSPLDPEDSDLRERLIDSGRRLGRGAQVVEVLLSGAESTESPEVKAEILLQTALVQSDFVGDSESAKKSLDAVLALKDEVPEAALRAAHALEPLLISSDKHAELVINLRHQVDLDDDHERKSELLARIARLHSDVLGDCDLAIEAWEERVGENSADAEALRNLTELYEKSERYEEVARVLAQRRESAVDDNERASLARHLADIQEQHLGHVDDAIQSFQEILDESGPNLEVLSALARLYKKSERWDELADIYERQSEELEDEGGRLSALAALGKLREERLNDISGALEIYRRALSSDMSHQPSRDALEGLLSHDESQTRLEAAQILEPIYEAEGNHEKRLLVLVSQAESSDEPLEKASHYESALRIAEGTLGDSEQAMKLAVLGARAAAGQSEMGSWIESLERLALSAAARESQSEVLSEIVSEIFDSELQLNVQRRIAEIKRDDLEDEEGAIESYRAALVLQSDDDRSLSALEFLLSRGHDHVALLEILDARLQAADDDEERKDIAFRRAQLLVDKIGDSEAAIAAFEEILDMGLDPTAIAALEKLYTQNERFDDLASMIQRRIDSGGPAENTDLRVELARVFVERQGDVERGLDELEQALSEDGQHEGAVRFLEGLRGSLEDATLLGRVAAQLEPIYMLRADYDRVLSVLSLSLDVSDEADERKELVGRIAQIHEEQKDDYSAALEVTARLLPDDPADPQILDELERLAKVAGEEVHLAEIYSAQVEKLDHDDDVSAHLCIRAGTIFAKEGMNDNALELLQRAMVVEPEDDNLFTSIDALLQIKGDDSARVQLYRNALEHRYEVDERRRLLLVIARLEESSLGNIESAIEAHQAVLEANESNEESFNALIRLFTKTEDWRLLAELYRRKAEDLGSTEGASFRILLADLYMRKLGEHEPALEQLEEIVREQPEYVAALQRLEAMRASEDLRARVVEILLPIYQEQDEWQKIIRLNEDRFEMAEDPMDQVLILRETGQLFETRGEDLSRANQAYMGAFRLSPEDEDLRGEIERICAMTSDWESLGSLYSEVLDANPDMMGRRDILERLAEISDSHLGDPRSALTRYAEISDLDEGDENAADAVLRLSLLLGDWTKRESALNRKAEAVYDEGERAILFARLGELRHLTLDDVEGALESYERSNEADEENMGVVDRLIALYEKGDNPERLVELYLSRSADGRAVEELEFDLLNKAASLLEGSLKDSNRAIEVLILALTARPGDVPTLGRLNHLYSTEERWSELLDNLRLEAGTAATVEHRLEVRFKIAEILDDKLDSSEEALEAYGVILDEKPDEEKALDALFSLVKREEHLSRQAAELLVPALRQTGLREHLVRALKLRLSDEDDPHQRVETLRTIAQVQESDLGDMSGAFESYILAIQAMPEADDLYDQVERLASAVDGWERLAGMLRERALEAFDADQACGLWVRFAKVQEERLKNRQVAIEAYQSASEQVGDRLDLLDALDRLYTELDDTASIVEVLERRMSLADTDEDHARLLCRQGRLQLDKQSDAEGAISSFRQALERDLQSTEASELLSGFLDKEEFFDEVFDVLDGVYRDRPNGEALAELHGLRLKRAASAKERLDMRRDLALVLEQDCKDEAAAQRILQEGLVDDLSEGSLRDDIERLCGLTGRWSEAGQALVFAVNASDEIEAELASELCEIAARWQLDNAREPDQAERSLLRASEFSPEKDEILEQLEVIQNGEGKETALLSTLRKRAGLATDSGVKIDFLRRCLSLAERLEDESLAEEVLREILSIHGEDVNALEALTGLRRKAEDYAEVYSLLCSRIELDSEAPEARELRYDAAEIARLHLDKLEEATSSLEELFEEDREDARVAASLRQAYIESKKFDELGELISALMLTASDPETATDLKVGLARLRFEEFDDAQKSAELLEEVLGADPRHEEATQALVDVYEKSSLFAELAGLQRRRSALALEEGAEDAALELLHQAASLLEEKAEDLEGAIAVWSKIRELRESLAVLETILRLQLAAEMKPKAAITLEEICATLEGEEMLRRRDELAELYREIGDRDAVVRIVEESLEIAPENIELRQTLRREYEAAGIWDKIAEMVFVDAEKAEGVTKVDLYREAASIHREKRDDLGATAEILEIASKLAPDDRELLLELCDAYSASGRGGDAAQVLEKIVESFGGKRSKELGEVHRRLATAYLAQNEQEKAQAELDKAFRIEPGNVNILKQLGEVAISTGDMKKAQQMFRALLLQRLDANSPITKAEVFCHLGQVHQNLGETPKAKQMFERALQTDPGLDAAKEGLASL